MQQLFAQYRTWREISNLGKQSLGRLSYVQWDTWDDIQSPDRENRILERVPYWECTKIVVLIRRKHERQTNFEKNYFQYVTVQFDLGRISDLDT